MTPEARTTVLLPDIKPLPSLLPESINRIDHHRFDHNSIDHNKKSLPSHLSLSSPTDDEIFLQKIENENLSVWGHDVKIRLIYLLLLSRKSKAKRNTDEIFNYLKKIEKNYFHITINYFWIQLVSYKMALINKSDNDNLLFEDFYNKKECKDLKNSLLFEEYYSNAIIDNKESMELFQLPDKKKLPSIV